jgi:hypothetical protein
MAKPRVGTYKGPVDWSMDTDVPNANNAKEFEDEFKRHALFYGAKKPYVLKGRDKWTVGASFVSMKNFNRYTEYLRVLLIHIQPQAKRPAPQV